MPDEPTTPTPTAFAPLPEGERAVDFGGAFGAEDIDAAFATHLANLGRPIGSPVTPQIPPAPLAPEPPAPEATTPPEPPEPPAPPAEPAEPAQPSADFFDLDGTHITRDEIRRMVEADQFLADNPNIRNLLAAVSMEGQPPAAPGIPAPAPPAAAAPEPPTPTGPPEDIASDPVALQLWNSNQALLARLDTQAATLAQHEERFQAQSNNTSQAFIDRAYNSFRQQHHLDDAQMARVHALAESTINIGALLNPVDPVTGKLHRPNPLSAMERAYQTAYEMLPETRDRARAELETEVRADLERKTKSSALSAGGASAPRREAAPPSDPKGKAASFLKDIAESFSFGSSQ